MKYDLSHRWLSPLTGASKIKLKGLLKDPGLLKNDENGVLTIATPDKDYVTFKTFQKELAKRVLKPEVEGEKGNILATYGKEKAGQTYWTIGVGLDVEVKVPVSVPIAFAIPIAGIIPIVMPNGSVEDSGIEIVPNNNTSSLKFNKEVIFDKAITCKENVNIEKDLLVQGNVDIEKNLSVKGDFYLDGKIWTKQANRSDAELATKEYIDAKINSLINDLHNKPFRVGTVYIGDVPPTPPAPSDLESTTLKVSGNILSAIKRDIDGITYVTCNFQDLGFEPIPFVTIQDRRSTAYITLNDYSWVIYKTSSTNNQLRLAFNKLINNTLNLQLNILLVKP